MKKETILDLIKQWSKSTPDKIAYTFFKNNKEKSVSITFKDVYDGASKYAAYLRQTGLQKGDRVIILADQTEETIYSIYGTAMAGGVFILVPSPVDQGKYQRLLYTLKSSNAKCILYTGQVSEKLKECTNVLIINTADIVTDNSYISEDVKANDIACLQYTSGSINEPKGIIWTHKNIMASMKILSKYNQPKNNFVSWLPFFHSMGLCTGVLLNMYVNNTNIIIETDRFMKNPIEWIEKISEYKSSMVWAPNSGYLTCADILAGDKNTSIDLSCIKYLINCSESIQPKDWDKIASGLGMYGLSEKSLCGVYGLSESTGEVSGGRVYNVELDSDKLQENIIKKFDKNTKRSKVVSGVGTIDENLEVYLVDPEKLTQVGENEIGEIWVKGDSVSYGYWNKPEETQESFKATLPGYEGTFLRTGDLGGIIDNQLYIMGRIKEMFIINGHNIFPKDIEANLKKDIEALENSIVYAFSISIENKERVVIGLEGKLDESQYDNIAKNIRNVTYKYFDIEPYDVIVLSTNGLIRTDNGKLALNKNRQAYLSDSLNILYSSRKKNIKKKEVSEFTEVGLEIKKIFENILETECYSMKDDFFELGGSSLKTVVLEKQLSQAFNIKVTSEDLIDYSSIENIENLIKMKKENKVNSVKSSVQEKEMTIEEKEEQIKRMHLAEAHIKSNIQIRNIEIYHPKNKIYIDDVIKKYKEQGQDIEDLVKEQLGKKVLYITDDENENSLTMSLEVVNKVLKSSNLEGKDIDMIVSSSTVPEYTVPPMSLLIHEAIKCKEDSICYDVNVNCAGMTMAIGEIYRRMESDPRINRVLLVGSEFTSIHMREDDAEMKANTSDAACAVIIERSDRKCGLLDSKGCIMVKDMHRYAFPGCGFSNIYQSDKQDYYTRRGKMVWNTEKVANEFRRILKDNDLELEDISLFCCSQLVAFNLKLLSKNLNISKNKLLYIGDKYGYTGTCSPFTALYEGLSQGKVKRGDYVLFWTVAAGGYHIFTLIKY